MSCDEVERSFVCFEAVDHATAVIHAVFFVDLHFFKRVACVVAVLFLVVQFAEVLQVQFASVLDVEDREVRAPGFLVAIHDYFDGVFVAIGNVKPVEEVGNELLRLGPDSFPAVRDVHRGICFEPSRLVGDFLPLLAVLVVGRDDGRDEFLPGGGKRFVDLLDGSVWKVAGEEFPGLEFELGGVEHFFVVGFLGEGFCDVEMGVVEVGAS